MTVATVLAGGLHFGEGPRWRDGRLWFSDFFDHAVKSVSLAGDVRIEVQLDDQPSGLGWTPAGELLIVAMKRRQVLKRTAGGEIAVHADLGDIATWHCNDMVVDADGRAYVGNFGFDLDAVMKRDGAAADFAAQTKARLALIELDGTVREAAADLGFPNGSVITPDGRTLILAETFARQLTAFDIGADGGLSNRRVWASVGERAPDGICLDADGAIWVANALAPECVRFAEGGEVVGRVETSQPCFACMLGGEDGRTLFMLTAPPMGAAPEGPRGKIETAQVEAAHAGRP